MRVIKTHLCDRVEMKDKRSNNKKHNSDRLYAKGQEWFS